MTTRCLVVVLLTLPLVGCNLQLVGKWSAPDAPDARDPYQFQNVEFKNDQTFIATARINGVITPVAGKWTYNMMKLKLDSDSGKKREYDAIVWWGRTLEVKTSENGKTVSQKFNKG